MKRFMSKIKEYYNRERPLIKLYFLFYLIGVFIGCGAAVLMRNDFSDQASLLFSPESCGSFLFLWIQQLLFFTALFLLGLTVVGVPLLPIYPLYKGFSIGLLISMSTLFTGVRGLILGTLAFFAQNCFYSLTGYLLCASAARVSISLFSLARGVGRHSATRDELIRHILVFLCIIPLLALGALGEYKIVPLIMNLY